MPTTTIRPRATPRHGLWVAALFVVLAGLFGMHGLADHGTTDMAHMADMAGMAGPTGPEASAGARDLVATTVAGAATADAPQTTATPGADGGHGMADLCLAVLAAGVLLLVLALLTRRRAPGLFLAVDPRRPLLLGLDRDPDPPSLAQLSILRC